MIEDDISTCNDGLPKYDRKVVWTTADGQELEPKDMETSHLKNCLNMMERNAEAANLHQAFELENMFDRAFEDDLVGQAMKTDYTEVLYCGSRVYRVMLDELNKREDND